MLRRTSNIRASGDKNKYGVVVVEYLGSRRDNQGNMGSWYKVKCPETGDIFEISSRHFTGVKSSQIRRSRKTVTYVDGTEISLNLWHRWQRRARKAELSFTITAQYIMSLYRKRDKCCEICFNKVFFCAKSQSESDFASLDRKDNLKGYIPGNIRITCGECNKSRGERTVGAVLLQAKRIYLRNLKRGNYTKFSAKNKR